MTPKALKAYRTALARCGLSLRNSTKLGPVWRADGAFYVPKDAYESEILAWYFAEYLVTPAPERRKAAYGHRLAPPPRVRELALLLSVYLAMHLESRAAGLAIYSAQRYHPAQARSTLRELIRLRHLRWHEGRLYPRVLLKATQQDAWRAEPKKTGPRL